MDYSTLKIRHTGLVTNDMEKSIDFFCGILGFELKSDAEEKGGYVNQMMGLEGQVFRAAKMVLPDGSMLELLEFKIKGKERGNANLNDTGFTHFAIQVKHIDALYEVLKEKNIECVNPPAVTENKYAKVLFCREPNGHFIELVEIL